MIRPLKSRKWSQLYQMIWQRTRDQPTGTPKSPHQWISDSSTADEPNLPESPDVYRSPKQIKQSEHGSSLVEESPTQQIQGGEVPMQLTQITDAQMREEEVEYATIEVVAVNHQQQQQQPEQEEERPQNAAPSKPMHQLIKERYKLAKKLSRKSASVANLQVLKDQQKWHQRKARKLGKLIAAITKDLDILADSESEADDSSDESQDVKMANTMAANHDAAE